MRQTKEKKEEVIWDKKKILITLVVVFLLTGIGFWLKALYLDEDVPKTSKKNIQREQIKGVSVGEASENISKSFQENINSLKEDAQNLNLAEVATSSPQVQKIIKDLQSLKDLPKNQLKDTCEKICGGL
ncbi:MAG: hypothetical protein COU25_01345 [Candidatus Levybacteria bacterium CG10_big_fil_rev_8_21_14_0_10_35_13]|nr:MAG: hypothetical protein COU25_01345 [Candidatus Levybacteria bacterium CG10_big_fil_rev_8_21_14_0_10_35_13]